MSLVHKMDLLQSDLISYVLGIFLRTLASVSQAIFFLLERRQTDTQMQLKVVPTPRLRPTAWGIESSSNAP